MTNENLNILVAVVLLFLLLLGGTFFYVYKRKNKIHLSDFKVDRLKKSTIAKEVSSSVDSQVPSLKETIQPEEKVIPLNSILRHTEEHIFGRIKNLFSSSGETNNLHLDEIEEVLYTSDLGPATVQMLMEPLSDLPKNQKVDLEQIIDVLKNEMGKIFKSIPINYDISDKNIFSVLNKSNYKPTVIMVVGVNGAGKTTTIGKMAALLALENKKVLVAAGDTFRAAAGAQLREWTERAQVEIFSPIGVTDPSAVAFDAVSKAKAKEYDIVIIDTAGRLHSHQHLMEELKKMKKVLSKVVSDAPHETLVVLDANSGQNALLQAKEFHQAVGLTGVVLTKMDGTAKGGVAVGISNELKIPIKLIGVGEKISDLRKFSYQEFIDSVLK